LKHLKIHQQKAINENQEEVEASLCRKWNDDLRFEAKRKYLNIWKWLDEKDEDNRMDEEMNN
jgi:hypothetical protein